MEVLSINLGGHDFDKMHNAPNDLSEKALWLAHWMLKGLLSDDLVQKMHDETEANPDDYENIINRYALMLEQEIVGIH